MEEISNCRESGRVAATRHRRLARTVAATRALGRLSILNIVDVSAFRYSKMKDEVRRWS